MKFSLVTLDTCKSQEDIGLDFLNVFPEGTERISTESFVMGVSLYASRSIRVHERGISERHVWAGLLDFFDLKLQTFDLKFVLNLRQLGASG